MAKKLVLDRTINTGVRENQCVTVPSDEVWKVSSDTDGPMCTKLYGGGYEFWHINGMGVSISGIAFKLVEV